MCNLCAGYMLTKVCIHMCMRVSISLRLLNTWSCVTAPLRRLRNVRHPGGLIPSGGDLRPRSCLRQRLPAMGLRGFVGLIASFNIAFGGLKAVIWTDVLQLFVFISRAPLTWEAFHTSGTLLFATVARARRYLRTVTTPWRDTRTVANIVLGGFVAKLYGYACAQTAVQRYSSMKSFVHAYLSIYLLIPFCTLSVSLTMLAGLGMFATYEGCDPLAAGLITKKVQILPFYVMDRLSSIPGLPGLFVACIFSGSLRWPFPRTIFSGVNSQADVTWEDVFSRRDAQASPRRRKLGEFFALGYGILATGLAFLGDHLSGVFQGTIAITTSVSGPTLAVYVMGLFLPLTNTKGAIAALITGMIISLVFGLGPIVLDMNPELLSTATDLCPANLALPTPSSNPISVSELPYPQKLLGLSYTQIAPLGFTVAFAVGIFTSRGSKGLQVERRLVHPWISCILLMSLHIKIMPEGSKSVEFRLLVRS
ncbi:sodium-dependent multivitamin transporter-like [Penaeus chinensis]|uniref:sodium-dependent multivitamin transporter-like n=1 Tax=Penaeus chinensis TaxID=139456 RepID=UPI001FB83330|nr:sodium-dependent multivitamin transporter-like [Penaeus chinensis]